MSEAPEPVDEPDNFRVTQGHSEDVILKALAAAAHGSPGFAMPITLTTAGGAVSGELIGRDAWFKGIVETHADAPSLTEFVTGIGKSLSEGDAELEAEGAPVEWSYLHLKDTYVYLNEHPLPAASRYWRGRISEVIGWSFGRTSPKSP